MLTKYCKKCNTTKSVNDFHKCKASKDGLRDACKDCRTDTNYQHLRIHVPKASLENHKICSRCLIEKDLSEFHNSIRYKDGHVPHCKTCVDESHKIYYKLQSTHHRGWIRLRNKKQLAVTYLGGKCIKCGYDKSNNALDLHHIDPVYKKIPWIKIRNRPDKVILQWIVDEKVVLLCSNCHRESHDDNID